MRVYTIEYRSIKLCMYLLTKKRVTYLARYLVILHIIIVRMRFWVCWLNCSESGLANKSLLIFSAFHLTSISSSSPSGSMCLISGYTNLRLIRSVWSKPWVEYFKTEFCTLGCLLVRSQAPLPLLYTGWTMCFSKIRGRSWKNSLGHLWRFTLVLCVWHNDIFVRSSLCLF